MLKCGMSETGVSVQEPRPRKHSAKDPQMGFEISSQGEFTVPPTIIETSSFPSTFERISNRLQWQEAKLGDNCVFFELGEELPEDKKPVGTLFNGNNWQTSGIASLESSFQQTENKPTKFDAVVIHANNFSKNRDQLETLLRSIREHVGHNRSVYISIERQKDLNIDQLKLELSKIVHDANFIKPHKLAERKGKNEDIIFETRTEARTPSTIHHAKDELTEAKRLAKRTPGEVKREAFGWALHHPYEGMPNGEKCYHCNRAVSYKYDPSNPKAMELICPTENNIVLKQIPIRS